MTAPDLEAMLPRTIVLQPAWNDVIANVIPDYRDSSVSDPIRRVRIPAGVSIVRIVEDSRFFVTVKYLRGGVERDLGTVNTEGTVEVISEVDTEMWLELSGTPNTSDRANTRFGMTIYSTGI